MSDAKVCERCGHDATLAPGACAYAYGQRTATRRFLAPAFQIDCGVRKLARLTAELEAARVEAEDHKAHWEAAEAQGMMSCRGPAWAGGSQVEGCCDEPGAEWVPSVQAYRCKSCKEAGR